jgi:HSP20 family molecular chaperone IbpA
MQRELERAAGSDLFGDGRRVGGGNYPPVNVFSGADEIIVQSEVPGLKKEDLDLSITGARW